MASNAADRFRRRPLDADSSTSIASRGSSTSSPRGSFPRRGCASLRDQLAARQLLYRLNIAEGCGRYARPEKAHFYLIARGSAMECVGVLDVALGRGLVTAAAHRHGRGLLIRVVQMLTKLALRMQA